MKNKLVKSRLLIIHGPNINLFGVRDVAIYGKESLSSINRQIVNIARNSGFDCKIFQSNHEGEIIDAIQQSKEEADAIIINAGAYSHYSIAIRDAIEAVCLPCIEVHCSNIFKREEFRKKSMISEVCAGVIAGFGKESYFLAIKAMESLV